VKFDEDVDVIYAVDDCCPENSGKFIEETIDDPRVRVLYNEENMGVGGAVLHGLKTAFEEGVDIGVKIDGDGQMDPELIPKFVGPIADNRADYTKGNRFYNPSDLTDMPLGRILGNAVLSFTSKFSTGYWNIFDPTNGYLAIDLRLLKQINTNKVAKRYFFETDLLFRVGLINAKVVDIPMVALYADEESNLKFGTEAGKFMKGNSKNFIKRIWYNYFLRDFSIASLELFLGLIALVFGLAYGFTHLGGEEADSAGIVMMAALPTLAGIMLLLSFLNYDVQKVPKETVSQFL